MTKLINFTKKYPIISIILGFQLFRLILLPFMGLMPQDAYYHFYGENLSLSYFDHPGMIGYILRGFTFLFGKSVFVVKLADFTITALTLICFYKLASKFLSKQKLNNAIILITSTLFISILSFNSTPDVPLLLFWTLSLLCLFKAIFENQKLYWVYAGIAMGLSFNSKYTALLLQFGLIAFVLFSNKYRKLFLTPWLWISLIISVLITFPIWWWNYQHDFASFVFQSSNRTGDISEFNLSPEYFLGAICHQTLLLLPILFGIIVLFTIKYIKRAFIKFKLPSSEILFLLAFFIPTFIGFFAISPIYWVKLNWMMPSYITGIILAGMFISKKLVKYQLISSIGLHLLLSLQVLFYLVPIKSDDTWVGWCELASKTKDIQKAYTTDTFIFADDGYKTSAALNFFMEEKVYAQNIIGLPALHFDYLGDNLSLLNNKNAIFLDSDKRFKNKNMKGDIPKKLLPYFNTVTELKPIILHYNNKEVRKFWVYYCTNYQTKP
ncbi:glycosyltransferase family 39 protein [Tenacibaculum aiptasiae]|uniref:Glycosyltransferase family 39 protein n=1 Tax=Tenacibaculum aiptasiae TaxID=426481 RepID=A0A7J5AL62_9FLAO|nr:glycosyltransferase family 39 protein [Tenacibaculum aiptasiae]KAB1158296.1 glycosyltransferase family 39 protein [Tenacibaculum aiptasiae]